MAWNGVRKTDKFLNITKRKHRFDTEWGSQLPESYRKFWKEWKLTQPTAVHYIPEEGRWKRDEVTGEVSVIQNIPLPVKYPIQFHKGLWGGEGIVQGFQKRSRYGRRVPHFWIPFLKRSVVRSEVLNVYLSVILTERTLNLIHDNYGFDHYLLKTPACDLKSVLALKLKRKILHALQEKCPAYNDEPDKQKEIYEEYKKYLDPFTPEDIEWYGLTYEEAIYKLSIQKNEQNIPVPLKHQYRSELIEQLKAEKITATQDIEESQSWISRINPFSKKQET